MKYVTGASVAGSAKTKEKASGTAQYVLDGGMMNGYETVVSNQVPANTVIFGDFSQLIIAMWGGLDIITERNADNGSYIISAFQSVDFGVRHAESFAATVDVDQ